MVESNASAIVGTFALGNPWLATDPFLFCAYHNDRYPEGTSQMGPAPGTAGRQLGQDFSAKDGWNMYHGLEVPGFPAHPHRGFETITVVRQGVMDHHDSLGASGRYGAGDTQWMTAGAGISHSEMIPLIHDDKPNPVDVFQIWLNLPAAQKMVQPGYKMLWAPDIPDAKFGDVNVTVVAGALGAHRPPAPPPDSWASVPGTDVAVWVIHFKAGSQWSLPAASSGLNRTLYVYRGTHVDVAGTKVISGSAVQLKSDVDVDLVCGDIDGQALLLQGRPIGEPVSQYGPFVMNTREELQQAFSDYQRTQFGGWPWKSDAPVHSRDQGRFARSSDGSEDSPS